MNKQTYFALSFFLFFLLIFFLLSGVSAHEKTTPSKGDQKEKQSIFDYFKKKDFDIFPIPVFESRPDEGLTFGLMPVVLLADESQAIKAILAAIGQYNSVTNFGGAGLAYFYPEPDQEIQIYGEMAQRYAREATIRFYNPSLAERVFIESEFSYLKTPFGRFFGLGARRVEENQSNFTSRNFMFETTGGFFFWPHFRTNLGVRFHTVDLLNRAIEDIDDTLTRYGGLPEVVDSTNLLTKFSLVFDNRPELEYSKSGVMAKSSFFVSHKKFLSDKTFEGLNFEFIHLLPLIKNRLTSAFRIHLQDVFGQNIPFYEQSTLGGSEEFRAFTPLRFVDKGKIIFQVEERIRLFDARLFGKSFSVYTDPFIEAGRVFSSFSTLGFKNWQAVGGAGFRLFVPPNIIGRLDIALGADGMEIYTELGYPF